MAANTGSDDGHGSTTQSTTCRCTLSCIDVCTDFAWVWSAEGRSISEPPRHAPPVRPPRTPPPQPNAYASSNESLLLPRHMLATMERSASPNSHTRTKRSEDEHRRAKSKDSTDGDHSSSSGGPVRAPSDSRKSWFFERCEDIRADLLATIPGLFPRTSARPTLALLPSTTYRKPTRPTPRKASQNNLYTPVPDISDQTPKSPPDSAVAWVPGLFEHLGSEASVLLAFESSEKDPIVFPVIQAGQGYNAGKDAPANPAEPLELLAPATLKREPSPRAPTPPPKDVKVVKSPTYTMESRRISSFISPELVSVDIPKEIESRPQENDTLRNASIIDRGRPVQRRNYRGFAKMGNLPVLPTRRLHSEQGMQPPPLTRSLSSSSTSRITRMPTQGRGQNAIQHEAPTLSAEQGAISDQVRLVSRIIDAPR